MEDGRGERTKEMRQEEFLERAREWGLIVQEKSVFLSEKGVLGLVLKVAGCGDLVCVVHGLKVLCVLRKVGGAEGEFRVVGQCYLDGWMYGEAQKEEVLREVGERKFIIV